MEAKDLEAQALRYNANKLDWSLVHNQALEPMVRVLMFGAEKYSPDNWKKGMPKKEILNSLRRHVNDLMDGIEFDKDSGLHQIGHIMCNCMFYSFFEQGLGSEQAMRYFNSDPAVMQGYFNTMIKKAKEAEITTVEPELNTEPLNDLLKQYPVTVEEAYKQEGELLKAPEEIEPINLIIKQANEDTKKSRLNKEPIKAPNGYIFVKPHEYLKIIDIEGLNEIIFIHAFKEWQAKKDKTSQSIYSDLHYGDIYVTIPKYIYDKHFSNTTT